ncbi:RAMP superfamily CRISPR-associated protein [Chrysosporum ovalisporum APH033B]|uniref:RAMP superfamily CRISPR-associated protein n=1 Tax=Umezakia ovalisporum TaxID=75695 RepID=UPI0024731098|nr:RAMP superfamily CRISPR-associated protein [Umezakia ovalisporum]MDH6066133.1 RAMP superfamily CRISPR-associated protein [Umezakia ovalisporum APH033B]MDH6074115.1 RAMP superfamily CRISPR-associated protein [Umezakia ovalisporum CS-1034]
MHKRFVNHCTIDLTIIPDGPMLIKSGEEGADPTKPSMEFVETYHPGGRSIYLPGSSLKGAIRAHGERIVRTVGKESRTNSSLPWANDPLNDKYEYLKDKSTSDIYKLSSFTDQIFGNTSIASRLRIEDAYPDKSVPLKLEERNGVAIDRVFGSVAVGPFNYQVCTSGEFHTKIHLKNFTLGQLGLIGLVLRDLNDGWFGLGFAKSRGLGTVQVKLNQAVVQYPGCILSEDKQILALGRQKQWPHTYLLGAGEFLESQEAQLYGFPSSDHQDTPVAAQEMDLGFGVALTWREGTVHDLFERGVRCWSQLLGVNK